MPTTETPQNGNGTQKVQEAVKRIMGNLVSAESLLRTMTEHGHFDKKFWRMIPVIERALRVGYQVSDIWNGQSKEDQYGMLRYMDTLEKKRVASREDLNELHHALTGVRVANGNTFGYYRGGKGGKNKGALSG